MSEYSEHDLEVEQRLSSLETKMESVERDVASSLKILRGQKSFWAGITFGVSAIIAVIAEAIRRIFS